MKKVLVLFIFSMLLVSPVFSKTDKTSEEYLKNKKHFSLTMPVAERIAQKVIQKALVKESKGDYKVKLEGYTTSSLKQGIFKKLEITGKDLLIQDVRIPYLKLLTTTDYNWIDYNENPVVVKSDINFDYDMYLNENSINDALKTGDYNKILQKVNKKAYPIFMINDVRVRIKHDKLHIIMEYNFPIKPASKNRTFMVSSDVIAADNKVKLSNVGFNNAYGNLPLDKVINLVNLVDPLSFTLNLLDDKKCDGKINEVKIEDNTIMINGKIFIKSEVK